MSKNIQRRELYRPIACPFLSLAHRINVSLKARFRAYTPNSAEYLLLYFPYEF